jgi:hypothetical protein
MFDKVIHVIVDIICLVDYDQVFLEVLNAPIATKIYALISILDFFQFMRTFATLVQTYIIDCALGEISKVYVRYKFVEAPSLILSLLFFVPNSFALFLFSLIDCVVRLSTFMNIVA